MKTRNPIKLAPGAAAWRNLTTRTAVASFALATATLPAMAGDGSGSAPQDPAAIRPFHVHFSDEALTDLRRRINATRWPERELVADGSQGVQLATMKKLARY